MDRLTNLTLFLRHLLGNARFNAILCTLLRERYFIQLLP